MNEIKNLVYAIGYIILVWLAMAGAEAMWKGAEPLPELHAVIALVVGLAIGMGIRWKRRRHQCGKP